MNKQFSMLLVLAISIVVPQIGNAQTANFSKSKVNMVASVHPLATQAGLRAFENGGNAVDAAIATALTLGVVDSYNSGIGGGCFILIRKSDGSFEAIDGREMAPSAATKDMYIRKGQADSKASVLGPLAIGVPGALKAYHQAATNHGRLDFRQLILPAEKIAEDGFAVPKLYSDRIGLELESIKQFPATAKILLKSDQSIFQPGEILKQQDLANSYSQIAQHGTQWFYDGPFSVMVENWMKENGGIITRQDLQNYKTRIREPIRSQYRGYEIFGFPPPSSGGVHVAQILNILESFELKKIFQEDPAKLNHVVAEAMKLAFADRAHWLGDSDFVKVPRQLTSTQYAKELASKIDLTKASEVRSHSTPPNADSDLFGQHTTHLVTADKEGNWVAMTTTLNTLFGSKVVVPETGILLNNQMDDFSIKPGVPNAYGLIGSENNSIAAGKRPLSSMSPTIVSKDGQPVLALGAAGGPKIITQVVWAIINHIDLGISVPESISRPRVHHQWSPDLLQIEASIPASMRLRMNEFGHKLKELPTDLAGVSQAIGFDPSTGQFIGAHDPRVPGSAAGQ